MEGSLPSIFNRVENFNLNNILAGNDVKVLEAKNVRL